MTRTSRFDEIAPVYDETRGGEGRGGEYAADIDRLLPRGPGTALEIGVGTGVVALGLRQRGWTVVGVDLSPPMLDRAVKRLGPSVAVGDARRLPVRTAGVDHAVAVWVIHDVAEPSRLRARLHPQPGLVGPATPRRRRVREGRRTGHSGAGGPAP